MNSPVHSSPSPSIDGRGLVVPPEKGKPPLGQAFSRYLASSVQMFLSMGGRLPERLRPNHAQIAGVLRSALAKNPRSVASCFASPTVGTPLQCYGLRNDMQAFQARIDAAMEKALPHLLFELAFRKLLPEGQSFVWQHGAPRISSLGLGVTIVPPEGTTALRFAGCKLTALSEAGEIAFLPLDADALKASADTSGFRLEPAYRRTGNVTRFALLDHNPIAEFEAHPNKAGNGMDLGERPVEEWTKTLDEAFALIEQYTPAIFAEMGMMLHEVVPVGYDREKHLSASYREAIGTVYMTLHPNIMTMAEAAIHEFQHNKANAASYSDDFLYNAFHPRYPSPVRPDPRPLWGILLAVHAFLPVAQLYRNMIAGGHPWATRPDWLRRMGDIDLKNHEGMEMLRAHAEWTPVGRAFMDEMEEMSRRHMAERINQGLTLEPVGAHPG